MSQKSKKERLRRATAEAAMAPKVIRFRPDPSPCPGDTFVLPETAEYPLEWAIIERDGADPRRLRVVPVDDHPQIGSRDLELHLGQPGRVANIRCDLDAWLRASQFKTELRTGMLPPEGLERIRRKRQAIASRDLEASLLDEEADGDPEYRQWKDETLQEALSVLKESDDVRVPVPRRLRWRPAQRRFLAVAASALLAVSIWSLRETQQVRDQLLVESRRSSDLERTQGELEGRLEASGRELRELRETSARRAEEQEQQVAGLRRQLRAAQAEGVHPNLPVGILKYDTQRSNVQRRGELRLVEHTLELRRDTRDVALVLEVVNAEPHDEYELRILDDATGDEVWKTGHLLRSGAVVSLSLPASVFELRRYRVLLYGVTDGEGSPLKEGYLLTVREAFGEW